MVAPVGPPRKHGQSRRSLRTRRRTRPPERAPDVRPAEGDAGLAGHARAPGRAAGSRTRPSTAPAAPAPPRRRLSTGARKPCRRRREHQPDAAGPGGPGWPRARSGRSGASTESGPPARAAVSPRSTHRPASSSGRGVSTMPRTGARRISVPCVGREPRRAGRLGRSLRREPGHLAVRPRARACGLPDRQASRQPGARWRPRPLEIEVPRTGAAASRAATRHPPGPSTSNTSPSRRPPARSTRPAPP